MCNNCKRVMIVIPQVDGWSTGPPGFGESQLGIRAQVYGFLGLDGYESRSLDSLSSGVTVYTLEHRYMIT